MFISAWYRLTAKPVGSMVRLVPIIASLLLILAMVACGGGGGGTLPPPGGATQPLTIQVTPATATLSVGQNQAFTATVANATNTAVSWSVQEGASGGAVTAAGVYTAPLKAGTYHVVAASQADSSKTASATVTVTAPAPAITSAAPTAANEGDVYTYALTATDPAGTAITFSLVTAPDGAQVDGASLTWTPTHAQSRVSNAFEVKATTAAGNSITQKFNITPTGTIRGTATNTFTTAEGEVLAAEDLTKVYVGASVPKGNGWQSIEGVTHTNGTFEIHGVPAGNYWFAVASGGYWTSASDIDLGADFMGRQDSVLPTAQTYLQLNFTGLEAWDEDDALELSNANLQQSFAWSDGSNPGDSAATALWDWTGPLSDASRGDSWYATQVSTVQVGNGRWRYLSKAAGPIAITQADGSTTGLAGSLIDAPEVTARFKVAGSQFAALATSIGSGAQMHAMNMGLYVQPFTVSKGWVGYAQTLVESMDQQPVASDYDSGDIKYGNPFPAEWTPFLNFSYGLTVLYKASGASTSVEIPAEIYISTTQLPAPDKQIVPTITPVRNIKLNGSALTQAKAVSTLSALLSWDAPSTGTPTGYRVTIYQLLKSGTASAYLPMLDLYTKDTAVTIADGILSTGNEYFFSIRAYSVPGVDFTVTPNRSAINWAHIDAFTPVVSTTGTAPSAIVGVSALRKIVGSQATPFQRRAAGTRAGTPPKSLEVNE